MNIKTLREKIENKTLNDFDLQDAVKCFAEKGHVMPISAEMAYKHYIKKGSQLLGYNSTDLLEVYKSFKKVV